jgi:hypothetical protein
METRMNNVTIALNNQVEASEAARHLGCAYSTIVALLAKKRLKGQKINRRWFVDFDDLQRAKSTRLIKTRISRKQREKMGRLGGHNSQDQSAALTVRSPHGNKAASNQPEKTELCFYIDKDKASVLQMVLQSVDKSLTDYIHEKVDELHEKIKQSLKTLRV